MTKAVVQTWLGNNVAGVARLQTLNSPNSFFTLVSPVVTFGGASRNVTITSTEDVRIPIVITGTYRNHVISETLTGPDNGTVTSVNIYDSVTSVFKANSGGTISIGFGLGQTAWIPYSFNTNVLGSGVQVNVTGNAGTITYNLATTFDDVYTNASPALTTGAIVVNPDNADAYTKIMNGAAPTNAGTSLVASTFWPQIYRFLCVQITAQSGDFNGNLIVTYIQQGAN